MSNETSLHTESLGQICLTQNICVGILTMLTYKILIRITIRGVRKMLNQDIQNAKPQVPVEPLLVKHSVPRTGDDKLPGYYDPSRQVWVVKDTDGITPIVEAATTALSELMTKTKTHTKQDDPSFYAFLEGITVTEVKPERDDRDDIKTSNLYALLELATKTETRRERDD